MILSMEDLECLLPFLGLAKKELSICNFREKRGEAE